MLRKQLLLAASVTHIQLRTSKKGVIAVLALLGLTVILWSTLTGAVDLNLVQVFQLLGFPMGEDVGPIEKTIFWEIRLPRVVLGLGAGAALAVAGAVIQGLFRNPLAEPRLVGVSGGAVLGAIVVLMFQGVLWNVDWGHRFVLPVACITGAACFTFLVYRLSKIGGQVHISTMLLVGIALEAFASTLVGLAVYFSSDEELRTFTFWTLGSLVNADWFGCGLIFVVLLLAVGMLWKESRFLNTLALGEAEAFLLGVNVVKLKRKLIVWSAVLVGATVALCGPIGFVGLVVPHIIRLCAGPDYRFLIPASAIGGGVLLVLADMVARVVIAPAELPIGILTSALGAPFFLGLLLINKRRYSV